MTAAWLWQSGLPALVALAAGCLLGLPGEESWRARVLASAASGLLTLTLYAGTIWFLPAARLWLLLLVLTGAVLLTAAGNLLRVFLPIFLEVAGMEER